MFGNTAKRARWHPADKSALATEKHFWYFTVVHSQSIYQESTMKKDIHPEYRKAVVSCVCGNTFETRSALGDIHVEICSACHPYYTGKQKLLDSAGRVERFNKKYAKKTAAPTA